MILGMVRGLRDSIGRFFYAMAELNVWPRFMVWGAIGLIVGAIFAFTLALSFIPFMLLGLSVGLVLSSLTLRIARYWVLENLQDPCYFKASEMIDLIHIDSPLYLTQDREVMLAVVTRNGFGIRFASPTLQEDEEIVLRAVNNDPCLFKNLSDHLRRNKRIILAAVERNGSMIQHVPEELRTDREILMVALARTHDALEYVADLFDMNIKAHRETMQALVTDHCGRGIEYVKKDSWNIERDRELIFNAVSRNGMNIQCVAPLLDINNESHRAIMLAAVRKHGSAIQYVRSLLDIKQQSHRAIMLAALEQNGNTLEYLKDALDINNESHRAMILAAVGQDGNAIQYVKHLLTDIDSMIVLEAFHQNPKAIGHIKHLLNMNIRAYREMMPVIVKNNDSVMAYIKESLDIERDRDFILTVVSRNGMAIQFVAPLLDINNQSHRAIMLAAVRQNGSAIVYIRDALNMAVESHREIALAAVNQNGYAVSDIKHLFREISRDKNIILAGIRKAFSQNNSLFPQWFKKPYASFIHSILVDIPDLCEEILTNFPPNVEDLRSSIPLGLQQETKIAALIQQYEGTQKVTAPFTKPRLR